MIRIVAVGRMKQSWRQEGCEDYLRRIGRYSRVEVIEVSDGDPASEAKELLARAKGRVIACDRRGETWSSEQLAQRLGEHGSPSFLIGGPEGLHASVLEASERSFSLGRITLPHELARVLLLEQIYRGLSILRGHPYHR